ncbi:hypothetical protein N7462_010502 [Penicillium macrosclerotiorum]|uniref:uncharacterized protein n=1 Tax=Penicillium macrosclerotiorum TaxID=303699 RepID=UPI002548B79B|nr:uncharacterized protein N7462_010502 [Penicillium macrosclerotiorum]KAJ5669432.1 hypothetical protein N7462_010502 [Penicillium macrosclerotiorum]
MTTTTASAAQSTFTPWIDPPAGVKSNFEHPETLTYKTNITIGIALPAVTIFFACRVWARAIIKRTWIVEDWLVTISWAGIVSYCAVMRTVMAHYGGRHAWDITTAQAEDAGYWFNIASVLYGVFIMFTKLSVLWLYRRVFSPIRWSPLDMIILSLVAIMLGFYISTTLVKILECIPRARIFDKSIPGHCVNVSALLNASGLFNTITDYIILLLPMHAAWKLQMNRTKKILVIAVFTFGLCAPVFSTVGFVVRIQYSNSVDTTWTQPDILLWGCADKSRKRSYPRRPANSYLEGSKEVGTSRSQSRKVVNYGGDLSYYELNEDIVYGVRVSPSGSNSRLTESANGAVQVHHEIIIESTRKEDLVR